ncbi:hypothetical protein AAFP30_18660 [Gordonia sp. CPCC 205515]|uniref:hypothetical protein n=1 Tax=Gordonia sp. CPCC 205515 TaxID=3140791 RepID=UPI003AF349E0
MPDAKIIDLLWPLPETAADLLRTSPNPQQVFRPDVHGGVLDLLLRATPHRGHAFVVFQLLSPRLPGCHDPSPDTVAEVVALLEQFEVSEVALHGTFGRNWRAVVTHAFDVADRVDDNGVPSTPLATDSHRRFGAWVHAREAAAEHDRLDQWYRAQAAAWEPRFGYLTGTAGHDPMTLEPVVTVRDAAAALSIADLAGRGRFTHEHFATLVEPGRRQSATLITLADARV